MEPEVFLLSDFFQMTVDSCKIIRWKIATFSGGESWYCGYEVSIQG
jgi:hypothetical protein